MQVKNLTFSYDETPVLKNLEFELPAGTTLAIVGSTGCGKSTLVQLLCRLYPVPRDRILIDGTDVNDIPLIQLRRSIGCVPQDTFLFSESIRDNLTFGVPEAPDHPIREAAHTSNILAEIQSFPDQMSTFVGERGLTLSGGQKQRMTISESAPDRPQDPDLGRLPVQRGYIHGGGDIEAARSHHRGSEPPSSSPIASRRSRRQTRSW